MYVNDPPVLVAVDLTLSAGTQQIVPMSDWFAGHGLMVGDDPSDGDIDGLLAFRVHNEPDGIFGVVKTLANGSCSIALDGARTMVRRARHRRALGSATSRLAKSDRPATRACARSRRSR